MKRIFTTISVALLALVATIATDAQSRTALRINEVMVDNENSIVDEYGNHGAWVELFNSNFSPLEISSVYLTNDKANPRKYPVPLGDVNTEIPARQHVLFFADGEPNKGTFHTSFTLTPGQDNWIGIYDADGLTLIDEVLIPASLLPARHGPAPKTVPANGLCAQAATTTISPPRAQTLSRTPTRKSNSSPSRMKMASP